MKCRIPGCLAENVATLCDFHRAKWGESGECRRFREIDGEAIPSPRGHVAFADFIARIEAEERNLR